MSESVNKLICTLYSSLETLCNEHEELTDTDVREALHMTLSYFFVWGKDASKLPISYGMFSLEGDRAISKIVGDFISSASLVSELDAIPVGKERLMLLQNPAITTPGGCQYDEFIGHTDVPLPPDSLPEDLFEAGLYDD